MGIDWWDTNKDGHLSAAERDRYEYDNGLLPGQPDGYWYDDDTDSRKRKKKNSDPYRVTDEWKKAWGIDDDEDDAYDDDDEEWDDDDDEEWDDDDDDEGEEDEDDW